jgi:2-C-methyl-D-erythritol 2,4-cyclodiphosphate synthase
MSDMPFRVGCGFDAHRLVPGRPLVLGGVTIPHERGLEGHSDADVLIHALCDAILGAIGAGDIGRHFPDTDPRYKGISSLVLLERTVALARERGWAVVNADLTLILQAPKIGPHVPAMIARLGEVVGSKAAINIKATTTEGMGFTGTGEGAAAMAVVLLQERPSVKTDQAERSKGKEITGCGI